MTPELDSFRPSGLHPDPTVVDPVLLRAFQENRPGRLVVPVTTPVRIRLAGRPYLAWPHLDGRPGYRLTPDRAQRFADRQETMNP